MILLWSQQLCRNNPKIWTHLVDYIAALLHPLIQGWCLGIKITNVKLYATFFFNWKGDRIFHQEMVWWQKTNDHFRVSQRIRIRLGSYSTLINGPVCVFLFIYFYLHGLFSCITPGWLLFFHGARTKGTHSLPGSEPLRCFGDLIWALPSFFVMFPLYVWHLSQRCSV